MFVAGPTGALRFRRQHVFPSGGAGNLHPKQSLRSAQPGRGRRVVVAAGGAGEILKVRAPRWEAAGYISGEHEFTFSGLEKAD